MGSQEDKAASLAPTALDRVVTWISPERGLGRMTARLKAHHLELHLRRYDGAARSRRTSGWLAGSGSANTEIGPALHTLRNRSRELVRNNGWATRAVRHLTNASVGSSGMLATPVQGSDALQATVSELWGDWTKSTAIDPEGRLTFAALQSLIVRECFESGEVLLRRRRRRVSDSLPVPFQIQLLEPDHIDTSRTERRTNGNVIIQGVEYNRIGRRVAYWLFPSHPGDSIPLHGPRLVAERVAAKDIIHLFEPLRVGQVRGVPRGAPALIRHRDFDEYEDASLVRAKIAAMTVAFITNDVDGKPATGYGDADETLPVEGMEPGTVEYLLPGQDVKFNNPMSHDGYEDYARVSLRAISSAWGVSYESLTGDLTSVNFSSGRMGWIQEARDVDSWRRHWLVPQVCDTIWGWFLEGAGLVGAIPSGTKIRADWTPPRREMIQPGQEIRAMKDQIDAGLLAPSEALRQLGYDPRQVWRETKGDLEHLSEMGIDPSLLLKLAEENPPESDAVEDPEIPAGSAGSRDLARNGAAAIGILHGKRS